MDKFLYTEFKSKREDAIDIILNILENGPHYDVSDEDDTYPDWKAVIEDEVTFAEDIISALIDDGWRLTYQTPEKETDE